MKQGRDSKVQIKVLEDKNSLGRAAAEQAASSLNNAIHKLGRARIVVATGASQFEFLDALTEMSDIDWSHVEMFHLDEYVGLPVTHSASFRKYLLERLIHKTGISQISSSGPGRRSRRGGAAYWERIELRTGGHRVCWYRGKRPSCV
jgi:hypothetical protein